MALGKNILKATFGIVLIVALLAFVGPNIAGQVNEDNHYQLTQEEDVEYQLSDTPINTTVTNIDQTNDTVTVNIEDQTVLASQTATLTTGEEERVVLSSIEPVRAVNVTLESHETQSATLTYEVSKTYGWNESEKDIMSLVPLIVTLLALAAVLVIGVKYTI